MGTWPSEAALAAAWGLPFAALPAVTAGRFFAASGGVTMILTGGNSIAAPGAWPSFPMSPWGDEGACPSLFMASGPVGAGACWAAPGDATPKIDKAQYKHKRILPPNLHLV